MQSLVFIPVIVDTEQTKEKLVMSVVPIIKIRGHDRKWPGDYSSVGGQRQRHWGSDIHDKLHQAIRERNEEETFTASSWNLYDGRGARLDG